MYYTIDKVSSVPLYRQVKKYILSRIQEDGVAAAKLPPEVEICRQFDISRATVRTAIMELVQEGILERVPGKGTFVKRLPNTLQFATWLSTEKTTGEFLEKTISEFNERTEHGRIEPLAIAYSEMERRLEIMAAGGTAPDFAGLMYLRTPLLAYQGALEPVDDLYPAADAAGGSTLYNGHYYGVNWLSAPIILYFRRDIIEKYSYSNILTLEYYDELCDIFETIHSKSKGAVIPFSIPLLDGELHFLFSITPFLLAFGGGMFDESGRIMLGTGRNIKAFRWMKKFIRRGHINIGNTYFENRRMFAERKLACMMDGPWTRSTTSAFTVSTQEREDTIGYRILPKAVEELSASVMWNHSLSFFKQCKDKKLALDFLKYLTTDPEVTLLCYRKTGMLPAQKPGIGNHPAFNDDFGKTLKKQMETATSIQVFDPPSFIPSITLCAKAVREILLGDADIPATLNNHTEMVRAIQKERF